MAGGPTGECLARVAFEVRQLHKAERKRMRELSSDLTTVRTALGKSEAEATAVTSLRRFLKEAKQEAAVETASLRKILREAKQETAVQAEAARIHSRTAAWSEKQNNSLQKQIASKDTELFSLCLVPRQG